MARTVEEQKAWERQAYGCEAKDWKPSVLESLTFKMSGLDMCLMSMLSDAQEMIERGMKEDARQMLNRVKCLLADRHDEQRRSTPSA